MIKRLKYVQVVQPSLLVGVVGYALAAEFAVSGIGLNCVRTPQSTCALQKES